MDNISIVIYTALFPFTKMSESFLTEELCVMLKNGFHITIVPVRKDSYVRHLPKGIVLDRTLCYYSLYRKALCLLKIFSFLRWTRPSRIFQIIRNRKTGNTIKYLYAASLVYYDLEERAKTRENTVFYGYWLFYMPLAFAAYKCRHTETAHKFIVRGHGTDVYAEEVGVYIPLRNFTFSHIDAVYTISEYGAHFLKEKYPQLKEKVHISRLGVKDNYSNKNLKEACFRFVSCSNVIPIKRVQLIFQSILSYARSHSDMQFEWIHIGDGVLFNNLKSDLSAAMNQTSNLSVILSGCMDNQSILKYYRETKINCFVLLSTTEGIPVSIMEAISSGMPVVATDVGGVKEIVNAKTGKLLKVDFTQEEFDCAVDYVVENGESLSESAHAYYLEKYNSEKNYSIFCNSIMNEILI